MFDFYVSLKMVFLRLSVFISYLSHSKKDIFFFCEIVCILGLLVNPAISQDKSVTELENALSAARGEARIQVLEDLVEAVKEENPQKGELYAKELLEYYKSKNDLVREKNTLTTLGDMYVDMRRRREAISVFERALLIVEENLNPIKDSAPILSRLGLNYRRINNYDKAIDVYRKLILVHRENANKRSEAAAFNSLGITYARLGDYQNALENHQTALSLRRELDDERLVASSENNVGLIYWNMGLQDKALEHYLRSLAIKEKTGDKRGIASTANNIGIIYRNTGDYDKALEYYMLSLEIKRDMGITDDISVARNLNNIGVVYLMKEDYDKALEYFNDALTIESELDDKRSIARSLNNIGTVYKDLKDLRLALDYHNRSLDIRKEINDRSGIAAASNNIGIIYTRLNEYDKALAYLEESLEISRNLNNRFQIRDNYAALTNLYRLSEDFENAFKYASLFSAMKDSLFTEESDRRIKEMDAKYEVEKKEQEIAALQEKERLQSRTINILLISIASIIVLAILIVQLFRGRAKANNLLTNIIDSLTHPFRIVNALTGTTEVANAAVGSGNGIQKVFDETLEEVKKSKVPFVTEKTFLDENGNVHYYEVHGVPVIGSHGSVDKVIEYSFDISDRKVAQETIKESEEKFRMLSEQSLLGILIIQNGKIKYVNKTVSNIIEYSAEEIMNFTLKEVLNMMVPEDKSIIYKQVQKKYTHLKNEVTNYTYRVTCKSGSVKWIDQYSKTILFEGKKADLVTIIDITDKIKSEEAINELKKQFYQSERLAATGRLSASIAHEINNPLQAITDSVEFVEEAIKDDFPEKESVEQIKIGIKRIASTVKQLLDINRARVDVKERININEVIESSLNLLRNQLKINKVRVKKSFCEEKVEIMAHSQEMFQVFMNFFLNAIDAMKSGGTLTVTSKTIDDIIELTIEDTGVGITEEDLEHIFEPFYTTKSNMLGTGLGLSTAKGIIESFGGEVSVKSKMKEGTVFTIRFTKLNANQGTGNV